MPPLSTKALAAEWKAGSFRPVYHFFGEDSGSKNLAVQALKKALSADEFNSSDFSGDTEDQADDVVSTCLTPPMFSSRRLVVVRNTRFSAAGRKKLADYLREPLATSTLVLISQERKPAAKDALAAGVEALGGIVLFKPLGEGEAAARLISEAARAGVALNDDAAKLLVEEAGCEWGILRTELEKVLLFVKGKEKASVEDAMACLGYRRQTNPFDLPRCLERRDAAAAMRLLEGLLREGHTPFALLYRVTQTLRRQLKAKRLLKTGAPQERIFRELRLQPYYDRDYLKVLERIAEPGLISSLRDCLETEVSLKSKAWVEPSIELETLVLKVCGKA